MKTENQIRRKIRKLERQIPDRLFAFSFEKYAQIKALTFEKSTQIKALKWCLK